MASDELLYGNLFSACPASWDVVPFEEAIDFQEGPGIMAVDFHDTGVPLIRLSGVQRSIASLAGCNYLDPEKVAKKWNHFRLKRGDLLISTSATIGMVSEIDHETEGAVAYTGLIRLRPQNNRVWPGFIKYFASSSFFIQQAEGMAAGSVLRHFGPSHLRQMAFPIPPLAEQKAIAAVLGALNDKIELNRRMNATLEAMARALFQSWFVDFDPVRAKLDGRPPTGLDPATAALFPDSFVESEAGHIPKGWATGRISDVASLNRDAVNPGDFPGETFDHFSLPAFDNGRTPIVELGSRIMSSKFIVTPNSVLLSKLNPHIPRIWLPDPHASRRSVCSTEFMVACSKTAVSREYLFSLFTNPAFASIYGTLVTGTTGSHQRIRPESVLDMKIVVPANTLMRAFTKIAKPIFDQTNRNTEQSRTLATLRDTLLPKLLSGKISVGDVSATMT